MDTPTVTLTTDEARTVQEILRYVSTANRAVVEASVEMYERLERKLANPNHMR